MPYLAASNTPCVVEVAEKLQKLLNRESARQNIYLTSDDYE
jgi:hypothetical protein